MKTCRTCKHYRIESQQCTNVDFVRESLVDVSGWGEMMVDEMMDTGVDTFGTPPEYYCEYYEVIDD
jgi:hypothetical protein